MLMSYPTCLLIVIGCLVANGQKVTTIATSKTPNISTDLFPIPGFFTPIYEPLLSQGFSTNSTQQGKKLPDNGPLPPVASFMEPDETEMTTFKHWTSIFTDKSLFEMDWRVEVRFRWRCKDMQRSLAVVVGDAIPSLPISPSTPKPFGARRILRYFRGLAFVIRPDRDGKNSANWQAAIMRYSLNQYTNDGITVDGEIGYMRQILLSATNSPSAAFENVLRKYDYGYMIKSGDFINLERNFQNDTEWLLAIQCVRGNFTVSLVKDGESRANAIVYQYKLSSVYQSFCGLMEVPDDYYKTFMTSVLTHSLDASPLGTASAITNSQVVSVSYFRIQPNTASCQALTGKGAILPTMLTDTPVNDRFTANYFCPNELIESTPSDDWAMPGKLIKGGFILTVCYDNKYWLATSNDQKFPQQKINEILSTGNIVHIDDNIASFARQFCNASTVSTCNDLTNYICRCTAPVLKGSVFDCIDSFGNDANVLAYWPMSRSTFATVDGNPMLVDVSRYAQNNILLETYRDFLRFTNGPYDDIATASVVEGTLPISLVKWKKLDDPFVFIGCFRISGVVLTAGLQLYSTFTENQWIVLFQNLKLNYDLFSLSFPTIYLDGITNSQPIAMPEMRWMIVGIKFGPIENNQRNVTLFTAAAPENTERERAPTAEWPLITSASGILKNASSIRGYRNIKFYADKPLYVTYTACLALHQYPYPQPADPFAKPKSFTLEKLVTYHTSLCEGWLTKWPVTYGTILDEEVDEDETSAQSSDEQLRTKHRVYTPPTMSTVDVKTGFTTELLYGFELSLFGTPNSSIIAEAVQSSKTSAAYLNLKSTLESLMVKLMSAAGMLCTSLNIVSMTFDEGSQILSVDFSSVVISNSPLPAANVVEQELKKVVPTLSNDDDDFYFLIGDHVKLRGSKIVKINGAEVKEALSSSPPSIRLFECPVPFVVVVTLFCLFVSTFLSEQF